jgi:transposase
LERRGANNEVVVTEFARAFVVRSVAWGHTQKQIADALDISVPTLSKYFERELLVAKQTAVDAVAQKLFQKAIKGNLGAQIFYLKTQGGWREVSRQEITGPDGVPLGQAVDAPKQLTREEWEKEITKRKKRDERLAREHEILEEGLTYEIKEDAEVIEVNSAESEENG